MNKNKFKKGFTIVELLVVIAVIGVLVLLAAPKFLGYTEKAKVSQVKSDIVAYEKAIDTKRIDDDKYIKDWKKTDVPTMESLKKSTFNKKGLINDSNNVTFEGEYYKIPKDDKLVKTNLKGDFYLGQGGEVYYYDEKLANKVNGGSSTSEPPVVEPEQPAPIETFKVTFKDYYGDVIETKTVEKGQAVTPPVNPVTGLKIDKWDKDLTSISSDLETKPVIDGPTDKELGYSKTDFTWQPSTGTFGQIGLNKGIGYFKYKGTGRSTVEIPHVIQGVPITSYLAMFSYSTKTEVTKVVSTNKNVTDMRNMFQDSELISLDLSQLDTSNVTNMTQMFSGSKALTTLDVSRFNTSNVTDMTNMFWDVPAKVLDVSNFKTSNVNNMSGMFFNAGALTLNVSQFNTSKVTDMRSMFAHTKVSSLNLSSFDISLVEDVKFMFMSSSVTNITAKQSTVDKIKDVSSYYGEFTIAP